MKRPRPRVNRRELLSFRRRASALTRFEPPSSPHAEAEALTASAQPGDLIRARRRAMGSYFEVRLPARTPGAVALATTALDLIDDLETQMTIYRDDSEVSRINATAHERPIPVEPGLFDLLQTAVALGRATGGAYDVASGALSQVWGFIKGPRRLPDPATLADARARSGQHHLTLDPEHRTVAFDRPGVVINLGSIGKGYALDRASARIAEHWWPTPALIHGGRSSLYALGSPPDEFGGRWAVALHNPCDPSRPLGTVFLRNRGMGTSGASFQQFEEGGRLYGHILDPRTGEPPSSGPASVTVLAPTAAEADALSTAFFLLGPDAAAAYIQHRPEVGAIFVLPAAQPDSTPKLVILNLTAHDFQSEPFPLASERVTMTHTDPSP